MITYHALFAAAAVLTAAASFCSAEEVYFTDSRKINLPCTVVCGPSGIKNIEVWITADNGETWTKKAVRTPEDGELSCWVEKDGTYGFRTSVLSNSNLKEPEPRPGDGPDIVFIVDTMKPEISFVSQKKGPQIKPGESAAVVWDISDANLDRNSCRLRFSGDGGRTWNSPFSIREKGRKVITGEASMVSPVFQIEAADKSGNTATKVIAFSLGDGDAASVHSGSRKDTDQASGSGNKVEVPVPDEPEKKEPVKETQKEKGQTITIITDGQPQEYYITPIDVSEDDFAPSVQETAVYTEDDAEIVIIDERADTPASPEVKQDKPVRIRSDIRQPEPAADLPDEITEEKAEQARKPVQETEALDGRAVRMCRKAVDYEVFDNFKMARRLYLAALKREPKYYRARKGLADLYFRNGYYKQALKHFRVLTTVDPENTDIIIYFGFCLYKSGNPVKAERELKKVLHLDPGNVDCMWYLSKIYKESKKIDDAVYLWVKIKNMGPRNNKWYDFADSYLNIYSSRIGPG